MAERLLHEADADIAPLALEQFRGLITRAQYEELMRTVAAAQKIVGGHTVWNVNSTANGGGVAEMLRSLVGYIRGAGLDARWLVISGAPDFFTVTKRLHNHLHGSAGDGGALDEHAHHVYASTLEPIGRELATTLKAGDFVILHDPQTAGLVEAARAAGAHVVWRCHVGLDLPNDLARQAWRFLLPYVLPADAYVFSRADFAWEGLDRAKVWVIPPSIDALSPKNRALTRGQVNAILTTAGVTSSKRRVGDAPTTFKRPAVMYEDARLELGERFVAQVSRWDRLKDPVGVMRGFAEHVVPQCGQGHLVLAGPAVEAVADDPEGAAVLQEAISVRERLPAAARSRIHLATLPMVDAAENAIMVNAIQRKATVVVQKSLAEGFGLTVAEAMWKGRPVVASRIGGIQDQIEDGVTGLLLDDPRDLARFGELVRRLLTDPAGAAAMGKAARERVRDYFLAPRHLMQYAQLMERLKNDAGRGSAVA